MLPGCHWDLPGVWGSTEPGEGGEGWAMPALSEEGAWQGCSTALSRWRGGQRPGEGVTSPRKWIRPEEMDHQPEEREQQPGKLGHHPGVMNCHSLQMSMQIEEGWGGKIKFRVQQWLWCGVSVDPHKYMFVNTLSVTNSLEGPSLLGGHCWDHPLWGHTLRCARTILVHGADIPRPRWSQTKLCFPYSAFPIPFSFGR